MRVVDAAGHSPFHRRNLIGPYLVKFRLQRGWTQEDLVVQLQLRGTELSRHIIANLESGRSSASDLQIRALAEALGVAEGDLFPPRTTGRPTRLPGLPPDPR